jgi:hypothetical protein
VPLSCFQSQPRAIVKIEPDFVFGRAIFQVAQEWPVDQLAEDAAGLYLLDPLAISISFRAVASGSEGSRINKFHGRVIGSTGESITNEKSTASIIAREEAHPISTSASYLAPELFAGDVVRQEVFYWPSLSALHPLRL